MITDNIKKALEDYRLLTINMEEDGVAKIIRNELVSLNERIDELSKELAKAQEPYRKKLDDIREYIVTNALEIATSFEHMGVKVSYRKGYDRITWTRKAMDEICLQNPALLSLLAPARKITPVGPSVSIAILETEKNPKGSP